jgi:cellulose synthase/poly-beta-1,6-N-acetylglucosamine synthase-like glycosyltransferase
VSESTHISTALHAAYFVTTAGLLAYGLQGYLHLLLFAFRHRAFGRANADLLARAAATPDASLPRVTTQLPLFNEPHVAERVLRAAAALDYPRDRHEIQVLDDSTEGTRKIVDKVAAELRGAGHDIKVLRRAARTGFKAGALRDGMRTASGGFFAIFDADFLPAPDFLRRTVPIFALRPRIGFLQTRWTHLNPRDSLLTEAQAAGIDAHFIVEQTARAAGGLFMNFNGTAGVWRRQAIEDAGGWQDDTLTEDLDLSYRAQLAGWTPCYLPEVAVPGELPATVGAYRKQQFRWAKGSIQTARKLLPAVLAAPISPLKKLLACSHLTHFFVHLLLLVHCLLALPILLLCRTAPPEPWFTLFCVVGGFTLGAPVLIYLVALFSHPPAARGRLRSVPAILLLGGGLALSNGRAVIEAMLGVPSGFWRTPKTGGIARATPAVRGWMPVLELALGAYALIALLVFLTRGGWFLGPFLLVYVCGLLYLGVNDLRDPRDVG